MRYETLLKIYYKYPLQYKEIVSERYSGSDSIHINFTIKDNPAFVVANTEIYQLLLKIHKSDKIIRRFHKELPGVAVNQFTRKCLIDEIVFTNDIEGVNSTRREIDDVLNNINEKKIKQRFEGLVLKYVMLKDRSRIEMNTCEDIRNIYDELVLQEVVEEDPGDLPDGKILAQSQILWDFRFLS